MAPDPVIRNPDLRRREVCSDSYAALPVDLDPVLRRVYAARRVQASDLNPALKGILPVTTLDGVATAAERLCDARRGQERIVVVGDFDADGATASTLIVSALRGMGFENVSWVVPDRFQFGYGLSPAVADLAAGHRPHVLITVDTGITSIEGVARACELGMEVIITDHHLPGPRLPDAQVIVNPNLAGNGFASKALCGVGVAFYSMAALAKELDRQGLVAYEHSRRVVTAGLDLVALGTVADLVSLDANNRILVSEGLRRMRQGHVRPGLSALFKVAGRDISVARSADLGFSIAPRLNAAGRLADMSLGIECLLETDAARAHALALRLDQLNRSRRELQAQMQADADACLGRIDGMSDGASVCLFDPQWHEGIVGLVASKMKERTGRPAIAFAPGGEPGVLKGSARSVEGLHIRDLLATIAMRGSVPGMVFGGHAMAAGLRLPAGELDAFRAAFEEEALRHLPQTLDRVLWTDGPLRPAELRPGLAEQLHFAGPWGQGFPEPLFDDEFHVLDQQLLKDSHSRLRLRHRDGGETLEAIAFNEVRRLPAIARLVYRLGINDFGGQRRQQLIVEHVQYD